LRTKEKGIAEHLKELEILLCSGGSENPEEFDKILHKDFFEFGSSGRIWNKKSVTKEFKALTESKCLISGFKIKLLSVDTALATYKARLNKNNSPSESLRCSIWKNFSGEWKIIFHQGTPLTSKNYRLKLIANKKEKE
jgi:hypothetical protein